MLLGTDSTGHLRNTKCSYEMLDASRGRPFEFLMMLLLLLYISDIPYVSENPFLITCDMSYLYNGKIIANLQY